MQWFLFGYGSLFNFGCGCCRSCCFAGAALVSVFLGVLVKAEGEEADDAFVTTISGFELFDYLRVCVELNESVVAG